jgi:hypothetical protein
VQAGFPHGSPWVCDGETGSPSPAIEDLRALQDELASLAFVAVFDAKRCRDEGLAAFGRALLGIAKESAGDQDECRHWPPMVRIDELTTRRPCENSAESVVY